MLFPFNDTNDMFEVHIHKVYVYYDAPRLFVSNYKGFSNYNLFNCVDWSITDDEVKEHWLMTKASMWRISDIEMGVVDVRSAFKETSDGFVYSYHFTFNRKTKQHDWRVEKIKCEDIPDDLLPDKGVTV